MEIVLVNDSTYVTDIVTYTGDKTLRMGPYGRVITLSVDNEGAEYVHALIKSLSPTQRGCATGQMCMWDAQTGLHADGTPCLYIHGERGPSFPMTDQDSEFGQ
jgi:hypothetical protein